MSYRSYRDVPKGRPKTTNRRCRRYKRYRSARKRATENSGDVGRSPSKNTNQPIQQISLKGRCQSADIIAAKGGGPGSNLRGSSKPLNFQASNHPTKKVSVAEGFFVLMRDCGGSSRMKRRWTAREMAV